MRWRQAARDLHSCGWSFAEIGRLLKKDQSWVWYICHYTDEELREMARGKAAYERKHKPERLKATELKYRQSEKGRAAKCASNKRYREKHRKRLREYHSSYMRQWRAQRRDPSVSIVVEQLLDL